MFLTHVKGPVVLVIQTASRTALQDGDYKIDSILLNDKSYQDITDAVATLTDLEPIFDKVDWLEVYAEHMADVQNLIKDFA